MANRREFDAKTKLAITKRATVNGVVRCEECRCAVARWEIHHCKEDALEIDKAAKLTADDGVLLCLPCHKELTRAFAPIIAKVKRIEQKAANIRKPSTLRSKGFAPPAAKDRSRSAKSMGYRRMFVEVKQNSDAHISVSDK